MENAHNFLAPGINLVGTGAIKDLSVKLLDCKLRKVLIVTDQNMRNLGYLEMVEKILKSLFISYDVFDDIKHPNCSVNFVKNGIRFLYKNQLLKRRYKLIISIGGGTNHDCAKALSIIASNGGCISDYEGFDKILKPCLRHIAINTTSSSGSDVSNTAMVTDSTRKVKMVITSPKIIPHMTVNDPMLMQTMPKEVTASSGIDVIAHAIEVFISTESSPMTDAYALKALNLAWHHLKRAYDNGSDLEARERMMFAGIMAGMAFSNGGLGYVHSLSHQLGGFYDQNAHGNWNAVLLPQVFAFNSNAVPDEKVLKIAEIMDIKAGDKTRAVDAVVKALNELRSGIGIPEHLRDMGAQERDLEQLSKNAMRDLCCLTNPRQGTQEDMLNILKSSF